MHEQLPKESLPEFPQTRLGELVVTCAEWALRTGRKTTLPIKHKDVESYRSDIETILQHYHYGATYLVRGRSLSKKLHRNLSSAVQEILFHTKYRGMLRVVLEETPGQIKPSIAPRLISIRLIQHEAKKEA